MYNSGKIKGFYPKSCYLGLTSNLFMNVMQSPGRMYYGTVPGPRNQNAQIFESSPIFARKMLRKSTKCQGPRAM